MEKEDYSIPTFLDDAINYLLSIRNLSKEYVKGFKSTIRQFLKFLNTKKYNNAYEYISNMTLNDIRGLNTSEIYSFLYYLAESNYKPASRIKKTEYLKLFFDYLYRIKHDIFQNTFGKIEKTKLNNKQIPKALSLGESQKLLTVYSNSTNIIDIRDNAILHLVLNCGLRLSEVANLKISDFKFDNNTFTIFGKGRKERTGYLNESTKQALQKYLDVRNTIKVDIKSDADALFVTHWDTRWKKQVRKLSNRGIQKCVQRALYNAGLENIKCTTHSLRHTCATILYKSGIDIKIIQELLGHVRIDTTEIYTHTYDKDVEREMLNHPLGRFKIKDAMNYQIA